ncbi:hypothetical protein L208DRAFT_1360846 [Tricholoma matsutake]|nr:hypothetical protein L208DRAFT_1360846 [Tricholoma matsutake 945]
MNLLHSYIHKKLPSAFVNTQESWPPKESGPSQQQRLRQVDPAFPRPDGLAFLLFDEGQDSYDDHLLWNGFLKGVGDGFYPWYHVILFCSYGSPSSRPVPHDIGTPLALCDAARISLWPREGLEESIGILFKRSEFDEVVSRFERQLSLHPDLLDLIFDWTVGHAGAVVEILRMISYQRVSETRRGEQFTVEAFHDENPTHALVQNLCRGAFERGLPMAKELSAQPDVAALFRNLLKNGAVDRNEDNDEDEATRKCHRHGWIHANLTVDPEIVRYSFPSPLHTVCISWRLKPTNDMPDFTSLFDLALDTISKFKPSQLWLPICRVRPMSMDKLPEAQYQDEFYRSVFSVTFGNVCVSPEFASARKAHVAGCIDFFIPAVKWGVEITRDGSRLEEHSSRFAQSGAYGAWLKSSDMADYILLDCRTSIPRKKHPVIQNLFHVVFQDGYQKVFVYNNMAKQVKGPIVLLENH